LKPFCNQVAFFPDRGKVNIPQVNIAQRISDLDSSALCVMEISKNLLLIKIRLSLISQEKSTVEIWALVQA